MKIKKFQAIEESKIKELLNIKGGRSTDSSDVSSELASGGTTTDTFSEYTDGVDCSSELASGGTTTDSGQYA